MSAVGNDPGILASARDLRLAYGNHTAVAPSTFDLPAGGVIAIIGPNGSGKSTLLHALAGIVPAVGGTLTVLGGPPSAQRRRVSYVMQSVDVPEGVPLSVRETVSMGLYPKLGWFRLPGAEDRARVTAAMAALDIAHLAKRQIGELSGGQRQRVYVAQGLAQRHDVLMLDEPLTGLDLVSMRTIDAIVHDEAERGRTVVMTTHDLQEAQAADFVVLMSGRVIAHGRPKDVLTRENLEDAYGLGALHGSGDDFLDEHTH